MYAPDVAAHIHDGGGAAREVAADVERDGPRNTDGQLQSAESEATESDNPRILLSKLRLGTKCQGMTLVVPKRT